MKTDMEEIDLEEVLEEPYALRQFFTFVSEKRWEKYQEEDAPGIDTEAIASLSAIGFRSPKTSMIAAASAFFLAGTWKLFRKYRENDVPFLAIPFSWSDKLQMPPGHPREDVLYAGHPSTPRNYLPVSEFHRLTFEDKFTEALRILMHLGACEIDVKHERGWDRGFAGDLSAGIPTTSGDVSLESESASEKEAVYYAELEGHEDPTLPDDLVWLPHESTWQTVVEGRKNFGMEEFSLTLQYTDNYNIDAELAADAENAGFSLSGSFEEHESTVWEIEGKFSS